MQIYIVVTLLICSRILLVNPILDGVRAHPILDGGGKKAPRVNSAI